MRKHTYWWQPGDQQRRIVHRKTAARHALACIIIVLVALVSVAIIALV